MNTKEIDFKLFKDKSENKIFRFTNSDGTVYDMTDSEVNCNLYLDGPDIAPTELECIIDIPNGKVTVPFTDTETADIGIYEYQIIETKGDDTEVLLIQGNISIINYVPFSANIQAYLNSELPATITLTEDYRNQRIFYWRRFLQSAFDISDANLNFEDQWPTLANALIAKLVVYDAMMLAATGNFFAFFGGDYTSTDDIGGPLRAVETGPARVEYYSTGDGIQALFQKNSSGYSAFDQMLIGLCGLANKLGIKIPMCQGNDIRIMPKYYQNPDWDYTTLDEMYNLE